MKMQGYLNYNSLYQYFDMDGDGESELLQVGYNRPENNQFPFMRVLKGLTSHSGVVEQVNYLNPSLSFFAYTVIGDYDSDGFSEIYTFTIKDSSLYMEGIEYCSDPKDMKVFVNIKLAYINTYQGNWDVAILDGIRFTDLNGDAYKECILILNGLYTATPRGIYAVDINNDSIWHSDTYGMQMQSLQICEAGSDYYFTAHSGCTHNCKSPLPKYHDHCGWAVLFDKELNLVFPPDSNLRGYPYHVRNFPVVFHDSIHLLSFFETPSESDQLINVRLYNEKGRILINKKLDLSGRLNFQWLDSNRTRLFFGHAQTTTGRELLIQDDLSIKTVSKRKSRVLNEAYHEIIKIDDQEIHVFHRPEELKLVLYSSSFNELAMLNLPDWKGNYKFSFGTFEGRHGIILSNFYSSMFIELLSNPLYAYRWLFHALILIVLLSIFLFMRFIFTMQLRRQQKVRETLIRNQLTIAKKQMEPHFMLNMLNNIGYMFAKEDTKQGQYYFGKYASLLHRGLKYADQTETTLAEEVHFIEDYLILQKMRFNDELDYTIEIAEGIDPDLVNIPHSLLYTFVENSIKHGLAPKSGDRQLFLKISDTGRQIRIVIKDNGVGRTQSVIRKTSGTGKGLHIVRNIINSYNKLYNTDIKFFMEDIIENNGISAGTKVVVIILR